MKVRFLSFWAEYCTHTKYYLVIADRKQNPIEKKDFLNTMLYSKDRKTGELRSDETIRNNVRFISNHVNLYLNTHDVAFAAVDVFGCRYFCHS